MKRILRALTWGMCIFSAAQACAGTAQPWDAFLANPSAATSAELLAGLDPDKCDWGSSENEAVVPTIARERLFAAIRSGSPEALRVGLRVRACLDGGDLGDFKRSAGQLVELSPLEFLRITTAERIEPEYAAQLASMLPLEEDKQILEQALERRISALRELRGLSEAQAKVRERCVEALSKRRENLRP